MRNLGYVLLNVLVNSILIPSITANNAAAQESTPSVKSTYVPSLTADGQPDLQGYWSNTTYTPLQRPKNVSKEF